LSDQKKKSIEPFVNRGRRREILKALATLAFGTLAVPSAAHVVSVTPSELQKDNKDGKDGKDSKDDKDAKDGKEYKDGKDGKDSKDDKDAKDGKEYKDGKDGKDSKDDKDSKDSKDYKDSPDGNQVSNDPHPGHSRTPLRSSLSKTSEPDAVTQAAAVVSKPTALIFRAPIV
jgi:hypothetical protein